MRHQVAGKKLNRSKGARIALRRNLINQLFTLSEFIQQKRKLLQLELKLKN